MDLSQIFSKKPNITESSKNLYIKNLVRLNDGEALKNLNFLKDDTEVFKKLEKYKPNTRRSYIISIVSLLKCLEDDKKTSKMYEKYSKYLDEINKELKDNTSKTEKEVDNWITQDDVKTKFTSLCSILDTIKGKKKITETEYADLLNCLILGLYTLQAPRRNADYQKCVVLKKNNPDILEKMNVLDLEKNKFLFSNYKTKGTYKIQEVEISPELRTIIDLYLKFHPLKKEISKGIPFLVDYTGLPYANNNDITRILYRIFDKKKIGSSMLRKIFLTDKYKDTIDGMKKDAELMGTSTGTIENNYIKN